MVVHLDADFQNVTFVDSSAKFVASKSGALIGTYRSNNWTFVITLGEKYDTIAVQARSVDYTNGFTYSGGLRYDAGPRVSMLVGVGQDVGASATVLHGVDLQHSIRADVLIHLL